MAGTLPRENSILRALRLRWLSLVILAGLILAGCFLILHQLWQPGLAWRWLILACIPSTYLLVILWSGLAHNSRPGEQELLPDLGQGNRLTFLRGMLTAALAGFLFLPLPPGWLAWLPGVLYTTAVTADLFDGYLARRSNHVTRLGEKLDMGLDGLGVLIGAILLVQYGKVPVFYLLVGLARYAFIAGIGIRQRMGKPVYDLVHSRSRRPFAGAQMGFIGVALFPFFTPPGTTLVAACFALPFLVGFFIDWLNVSGVIRDPAKAIHPVLATIGRILTTWGALILRLAVTVTLFWILFGILGSNFGSGSLNSSIMVMTFFGLLGGILMALGAAGRVAALAALFSLGMLQNLFSLGPVELLLIIGTTAVFFLGSGAYSIWTPETLLISKRIGEN
jgi:CDP-diacylglycerol--glycerol-3-phosphate 3-phosphatidyltransferase